MLLDASLIYCTQYNCKKYIVSRCCFSMACCLDNTALERAGRLWLVGAGVAVVAEWWHMRLPGPSPMRRKSPRCTASPISRRVPRGADILATPSSVNAFFNPCAIAALSCWGSTGGADLQGLPRNRQERTVPSIASKGKHLECHESFWREPDGPPEQSLGKDEDESSILSSSTIPLTDNANMAAGRGAQRPFCVRWDVRVKPLRPARSSRSARPATSPPARRLREKPDSFPNT